MRFIFLDIDGVLNYQNCKFKTPSGYYFVDDEKIKLLKEIVEKTNAKIVLSSTWRDGWEDFNNGCNTINSRDFLLLKEKLQEYGLELYDYTSLPIIYERGSKILEWIENHFDDVSSILILDDDAHIKPLGKFLIRTSYLSGLCEKHVRKGIEILEADDFKGWYEKKLKKEKE